jgi:cystathionine beta-lyase
MAIEKLVAASLEELHTHRSEKWRGFPSDVLPLPVAEMDFPIAAPIKQILLQMVSDSDLGYLGSIPELGYNFAHFAAARWNWQVNPIQVRLATDVGVAAVEVLRAITQPGDRILINSPIYQNFYNWINEVKLEKVDVPFTQSAIGWELDFAAVESAYQSGIKVHMLCSPHNPLGRVFSAIELDRFAELAAKYNVLIISDEIHAPLTYSEKPFIPFLGRNDRADSVGICITSASKAWNMAGLKCAIIVTANEKLHQTLEKMPMSVHYRASLLGAFASAVAFAEGESWLDQAILTLDHNRKFLKQELALHLPKIKYAIPESSYLAWLDLSDLNLGENPADVILEKGRVALNPGSIYGEQSSHFVRFNFATSPEIISEAITRIVKAVQE